MLKGPRPQRHQWESRGRVATPSNPHGPQKADSPQRPGAVDSSIGNEGQTAATVANRHSCSGISAVAPLFVPIFAFAKKALRSPCLMVYVP